VIDKQKYEAVREHQIALEHERALRNHFDGIVSMEDEVAESTDSEHYRKGLFETLFGWMW
jgi:hypothetical protein